MIRVSKETYQVDPKKIVHLLKSSKLSNAEIARRSGLSRMTISYLRRGEIQIKNISLQNAIKLCRVDDGIRD